MSWWKAANMTVTANSKFITVLSGDSWELLSPTDGLVAGNNAPVEIKRAYFDGTNTIIELVDPWPNSTSNNLTGVAFPTDADLGEISKALSNYLESFTLATGTDATTGTENTRPMTALRVREAMNSRLGNIGLNFKVTRVGFNSFSTPEALVTLFGDPVEYSSALIQFEAPEMFGFVRGFVQSTDNYNYSFQEFTGASDKKYFRTATSATTWTPWKEFLMLGDFGFGTNIAGILSIVGSLTPLQIVANAGDFKHYTGTVLNHGSYAPSTFGVISGYVNSNNNYSYTYQEFSTLYGEKYHRTAAGANSWNPWKKIVVEGDYGLGSVGALPNIPSGDVNTLNVSGSFSVPANTPNWAFGAIGGILIHTSHGNNVYSHQRAIVSHVEKTRHRLGDGSWTTWKEVKNWEDDGFWKSTIGTANLNALTANGIYREEAPTSGISYSSTLNMHSNDGRQQMTIDRVGNRMAFRGSAYGANGSGDGEQYWYSWKELYHTGNVVGSMKGVLWDTAGACPIIERGSNSNGSWTAFADGTIIAWGRVIATGQSINPAGRSNANTGYLCDPIMPTNIIGKVITLGQHALYATGGSLIYSVEAASSAGLPIILNLGTRPADAWPRLDEIGTNVAVEVDYYWTAVGRWK